MRILLALILVLALAGPVDAILVEGTIVTFVGTDFVPVMNLRGEEFSLGTGISGNSIFTFNFPFRSDLPVDVSDTWLIQSRGSVTYQGQTFSPTIVTGPLTFDVEPFLLRPDPGAFQPGRLIGDSPFTMTGELSFDGHTVALEGSGVLTARGFAFGPGPFAGIDQASYNFTPIPEPGTLLLFGTAAGLGALYGLRKRQGNR
jgi:PEP-CTERM motif